MGETPALVDRLQQFGFSETEASVYLAAVERGDATPSDVASAAGVSASYVYQVCDSLEDEGLISVEDHHSPTRIVAHPPEKALRERLETLNDTMDEMARRYERPSSDDTSLEIVRSRPTLYKRIRRVVERTTSEIFLSLPVEVVAEVADALRDAIDRDVLVLLAIAGDPADTALDLSAVATVARTRVRGMTAFVVGDQARGTISPSSLFDWKHGSAEAIRFANASVAVAVECAFLGTVWPTSEEVATARPTALPETYEGFRRAVYDATLHRRADHPVHVEVTASPVGPSGRREQLSGRLVGVCQNLVDPLDGDFGMRNTLVIEGAEGRYTVGAVGAFLEDYEAHEVTLEPVD